MPAHVRIFPGAIAALLGPAGPVGAEILRRTIRVETAAKRMCPVDTGRLRASINHRLEVGSRGLQGIVGSDVEYAAFVELGTRFMSAQPYLRPALSAA